MSSAESVPVKRLAPWTEADQRELEESRRRPQRTPRPPARGRRPRPIRRRPVSPALIARLCLTADELTELRAQVAGGLLTIAELGRRWGISRPSASAVVHGYYRAK